jgi:hypothetical protein
MVNGKGIKGGDAKSLDIFSFFMQKLGRAIKEKIGLENFPNLCK